jgi:hypothetical protein
MKRRDILTGIFMFAIAISLITVGQVLPAQTSLDSHDAFLSVRDYDKQKNCTTDLDKRPKSIE